MDDKNIFCIISNNCWGAEVYKKYELPYNTPFVGLFIPPADFVKMCNNLLFYLDNNLVFTLNTKYSRYVALYEEHLYPIGLLGDVEIHFLHYKDEEEAFEKWTRRKARMPENKDNWIVKGCDREIDDWATYITQWNKIPYKKVFFSAKKRFKIDGNIWIFEYFRDKYVIDGKALFAISEKYFDIINFVRNGEGKIHLYQTIKRIIKK